MKLLNRSFGIDDINNFVGILIQLNQAINTTYIPVASCIPGLMQRFTEIQLGRSFTPGYSSADLSLVFNERYCIVYYSSTSGTVVNISYNFDNDMKISSIDLEVDLPDDRIGGCHYETITKALYRYDFYHLTDDKKDMVVVVPNQLQSINPGVEILIPQWVIDIESNYNFRENRDVLLSYGYKEIDAVGVSRVWQNPEMYFEYIVEDNKYSWADNALFVLTEKNTRISDYPMSFRRVKEILDEAKTKTFVKEKRQKYGFRSDDELEYDSEEEYSEGDYEDIPYPDEYTDYVGNELES